jgi:predicted transcriptional regulator
MTITLTLPDDLYQWVVEIAGRHDVSAERIATAALAEQMAQWARVEALAAKSNRDRFLAAMDRAPDVEPAPEDRR